MPTPEPDRDPRLRAFGDRVRLLRQKYGWSQEALAEAAGLHRNHLGRIERGEQNPSLTVVIDVAAALDVPVEKLLRGLKG